MPVRGHCHRRILAGITLVHVGGGDVLGGDRLDGGGQFVDLCPFLFVAGVRAASRVAKGVHCNVDLRALAALVPVIA